MCGRCRLGPSAVLAASAPVRWQQACVANVSCGRSSKTAQKGPPGGVSIHLPAALVGSRPACVAGCVGVGCLLAGCTHRCQQSHGVNPQGRAVGTRGQLVVVWLVVGPRLLLWLGVHCMGEVHWMQQLPRPVRFQGCQSRPFVRLPCSLVCLSLCSCSVCAAHWLVDSVVSAAPRSEAGCNGARAASGVWCVQRAAVHPAQLLPLPCECSQRIAC